MKNKSTFFSKKSPVFKYISFILILMMLVGGQAYAATEGQQGSESETKEETVSEVVYGIGEYYKNENPTLTNWEEVLTLDLAGYDLNEAPWNIDSWDMEEIEDSSPATIYAGRILGLLAVGENPISYEDRNLLQELVNKQQGNGSFGGSINNTVWAMIALDKAGVVYNEEKAIEYISSQQKPDGGFSISDNTGDPDTTGETLLALSNHKGLSEVDNIIVKAIDFLKNVQLETGGFSSLGSENSQSSSRVILGLLAVGEDLLDEEWKKNDITIIDALLEYKLSNQSFMYLLEGNSNSMATKQAFRALVELNAAGYGDYEIVIVTGDSQEQDKKTVRVRVEGSTKSLADEIVTVEGTTYDALVEAVGSENVVAPGGYVNTIMQESGETLEGGINTSWMYYIIRNGEIFSSDEIETGDEVIFYISAFDSNWNGKTYFPNININPSTPTAEQLITINISAQKNDWSLGLLELNDEEVEAIGDYTVKIGEKEYISQDGKVTISDLDVGVYEYSITNKNELQYPDVITYKGSINVIEKENDGGAPTPTDEITVDVEIVGRDNKSYYDDEVDLPKNKANAFEALKATGVSFKARDNNSYIYEIAGEREDSGSTAGWKYKVGSRIPGISAMDYTLDDGDRVLWFWAEDYNSTKPSSKPKPIEPEVEEIIIEEEEKQPVTFADVNEDSFSWALEEISYLSAKGIITGVEDNTFEPAREVTRGEFTALLVRALGLDYNMEYQGKFEDVKSDSWYAGFVQAAVENGIIKGISENNFDPNGKLTREQAAVMVAKALEISKNSISTTEFKDKSSVSDWAGEAIEQVVSNGIFSGFPDKTFRPKESLTRAQSAVAIYKLIVDEENLDIEN